MGKPNLLNTSVKTLNPLLQQLLAGLALAVGHHARPSPAGLIWTAVTAVVMFALSADKARTGKAQGNPVLIAEGKVTFIDGLLAAAVLAGILLDTLAGWWWAYPVASLVIVYYAVREALAIFRHDHRSFGLSEGSASIQVASAACWMRLWARR
jgi:divalent metal cation (Fe/Co/Zn/Cd) transporter